MHPSPIIVVTLLLAGSAWAVLLGVAGSPAASAVVATACAVGALLLAWESES